MGTGRNGDGLRRRGGGERRDGRGIRRNHYAPKPHACSIHSNGVVLLSSSLLFLPILLLFLSSHSPLEIEGAMTVWTYLLAVAFHSIGSNSHDGSALVQPWPLPNFLCRLRAPPQYMHVEEQCVASTKRVKHVNYMVKNTCKTQHMRASHRYCSF